MELFADRDEISFHMPNLFDGVRRGRAEIAEELRVLEETEKRNGGNYLCVPLITSPVIEISKDRKSAEGSWLVMTYEVQAGAFGHGSPPYEIVRRLGFLHQRFVKERSKWKILDFDLNIIMTQSPFAYDCTQENTRYHRMSQPDHKWRYSLPQMGGVFPNDAVEVEAQLPYWLNALRRGELGDYIQEHMENEVQEIVFISLFTGKEAPPVVGLESFLKKFTGTPFQYHHQQVCYHTDTTPIIEISADGRFATATYFDQSWTPYDADTNIDVRENLKFESNWNAETTAHKCVRSISLLSKYEHEFIKIGNEWKHVKIFWEPMISFPDWELAGAKSRGWSGSASSEKYPKLWEKYNFCPDRKV